METRQIASRIRYLMKTENMEEKELSKQLNISETTMKKKLNGDSKFYIDEIEKIREIFNLDTDTFANIFFNPKFNQKKKPRIKTKK